MPPNSPLVLEYANIDATPFVLAPAETSALRPTGPSATETLPPSVKLPACENVRTAWSSLRMKTKSVSSRPINPPKPPPTVAIAEGADQEPSGRRATRMPDPNRREPRKPARVTVQITRPWGVSLFVQKQICSALYLCVRKNSRRNHTRRWARKGLQNLARLFAFACGLSAMCAGDLGR
jgi:hypothetical protein